MEAVGLGCVGCVEVVLGFCLMTGVTGLKWFLQRTVRVMAARALEFEASVLGLHEFSVHG